MKNDLLRVNVDFSFPLKATLIHPHDLIFRSRELVTDIRVIDKIYLAAMVNMKVMIIDQFTELVINLCTLEGNNPYGIIFAPHFKIDKSPLIVTLLHDSIHLEDI